MQDQPQNQARDQAQDQPRVLYVEDDAMSRKMMRLLLQGRLHFPDVTIFENSENFESRVDSLDPKPAIIFLDIHMKPYTGFEMLRMLRTMPWTDGVPIIALTASVMHEEVQQLMTVGFDGCLGKPIDLDTFPDTLQRILKGEHVWRIVS